MFRMRSASEIMLYYYRRSDPRVRLFRRISGSEMLTFMATAAYHIGRRRPNYGPDGRPDGTYSFADPQPEWWNR